MTHWARIVLVVAAFALASTASLASAEPVVSVAPSGQTDVCLNDQHSAANPSSANSSGVLQLANNSCSTTGGSTPSTSTAGAQGGSDGTQASGSTTTGSSQTTTKSKSSTSNNSTGTNTTTSRRAAAFSLAGSVAAAKASGLRIAKVRYQMVRAKHVKRLRVLVTVRDGKRRLVRTAIVSIGGLTGAKTTLARTRLGFTNRKGQAAFVVVLKQSMLGRRLLVRVGARTPHARALTVGAVAVPKQVPKRGALQHITYA